MLHQVHGQLRPVREFCNIYQYNHKKMKNIQLYEEYSSENIIFNDGQIQRAETLWNSLHFKYRSNKFFTNLFDKMKNQRTLSKKQWNELNYLLTNGKSRYESGILPKNY